MVTSSYENLVVAYFTNHSNAENAVRDLQRAGFRSNQIGSSYEDYDTDTTDSGMRSNQDSTAGSTATEATDHRSFWEKVRDFFSGEPEHGHDVTSEAASSESSFGVPPRYRELLARGGELISVRTEDRKAEAQDILTRNNGQVDREFASSYAEQPVASEVVGEGTGSDIAAGNYGGASAQDVAGRDEQDYSGEEERLSTGRELSDERRIQLISEVLRVRKERVNRGEVRLRKEVLTETQNVQVPVTREEIVIERNPASADRSTSGTIGEDREVRVPLSEERVQVDKVPVVREEVRVGKRAVSETQNVSDQVRREELEVEGADESTRDSVKGRKSA
jgi:uncharacterized protein (TIGR02271 family)